MRFIFAFIITLFVGQVLTAQEYVFSALVVNGTSMIQRGSDPDEFVRLQKGVKVYENDMIIVTGADSYIGLASPVGKVTEITIPGVFRAEDLVSNLVSGDASMANEYLQILAGNLLITKEMAEKYAFNTGGLERSSSTEVIELFAPTQTKISLNSTHVTWSTNANNPSWEIVMTNLYDEQVFSQITNENGLTIDFSTMELASNHGYRIYVHEVGDETKISNQIILQVPTRSELAKFETDLAMLIKEVPENSAISDMIFATYFESQGLYLQAIPYYQSAIQKEPKTQAYKNAYDVFLYKIGLE